MKDIFYRATETRRQVFGSKLNRTNDEKKNTEKVKKLTYHENTLFEPYQCFSLIFFFDETAEKCSLAL